MTYLIKSHDSLGVQHLLGFLEKPAWPPVRGLALHWCRPEEVGRECRLGHRGTPSWNWSHPAEGLWLFNSQRDKLKNTSHTHTHTHMQTGPTCTQTPFTSKPGYYPFAKALLSVAPAWPPVGHCPVGILHRGRVCGVQREEEAAVYSEEVGAPFSLACCRKQPHICTSTEGLLQE